MISFITRHWVWLIVAILVIYLYRNNKKMKDAEAKALAAYGTINNMIAKSRVGPEYDKEKASLIKLLHNTTDKEKAALSDLLNGTISTFTSVQQAKDKEQAKTDYQNQLAKMQSDLVTKYGKANVMSLKAKMDKYGFVI